MRNKILLTVAMVLAINSLGFANSGVPAEPKKSNEVGGEKPTLKISGNAKFTYHSYRNGLEARTGQFADKGHDTAFALEDSRLNFQATGRMESGWLDQTFFDYLIGFTGNTAETKNVEENRLRVKGRWGTAIGGNYQGVENFMARGAFSVMGGTGGFDGNFKMTTSRPTGLLLTTDMVGATKYATKFSYVTPRFYGFQAGFSFAPNSEHKGEGTDGAPRYAASTKNPQEPFDRNSIALGVNYINKFNDDASIALSVTSIFGKTHTPARGPYDNTNVFTAFQSAARHNTKSFALGGVGTYKGFELGLEWVNNGKSQQIKDPAQVGAAGAFNAGQHFSVATAYTFGDRKENKVSYGFGSTKRKFNGENTTGKIHSVAYDRTLAPGFGVFAEGVAFNLKGNQTSAAYQDSLRNINGSMAAGLTKNNGRTFLLGATTKF